MKGKKKSKLELVQEKAQAAINKTNDSIEELGKHTSCLYDSLTSIQDLFDKIRNVPTDKKSREQEQQERVWELLWLLWDRLLQWV